MYHPVTTTFTWPFPTIIFITRPIFQNCWWYIATNLVIRCAHITVMDDFLLLCINNLFLLLIKVFMYVFWSCILWEMNFLSNLSMVRSQLTMLFPSLKSIKIIASIQFPLVCYYSYVSLLCNMPFHIFHHHCCWNCLFLNFIGSIHDVYRKY